MLILQIGGTYTICATWLRNDVKKNLDVSIPEKRTTHTHTNLAQSLSVENAKRNEKCLETNGKN